jgi:dolichol-phosphate mannosyltransferase
VKKSKKVLIFSATYNEVENIQILLKKILDNYPKIHILIIDDNSPDGTKEKINEFKKNYKNIFLISRKDKLGLDSAHKMAYDYALVKNYDYLITMDADLSHDPKEIKNFIKYLDHYPFVIGSRYIKGGKCLMQGKRLALSKYGNLFIKKTLNININEFTTSYRGFNLKKLEKFNLKVVKNKGYSFFMGTVIEIFNRKFNIKEIPIIFKDRFKGKSKIPKLEIFRTLKNLVIFLMKKIL